MPNSICFAGCFVSYDMHVVLLVNTLSTFLLNKQCVTKI